MHFSNFNEIKNVLRFKIKICIIYFYLFPYYVETFKKKARKSATSKNGLLRHGFKINPQGIMNPAYTMEKCEESLIHIPLACYAIN